MNIIVCHAYQKLLSLPFWRCRVLSCWAWMAVVVRLEAGASNLRRLLRSLITRCGSRSYHLFLSSAGSCLSLALLMLIPARPTHSSNTATSTHTVTRINIYFKQTHMPLLDLVRSCFQLLGVMLLLTQTASLALSILFGLVTTFLYFLKSLVLLSYSILLSKALLFTVAWAILIKLCTSEAIFTFIRQNCGEKFIAGLFLCSICKERDSEMVFNGCYHAFHLECVRHARQYGEAGICPQCLENKEKGKEKEKDRKRKEGLWDKVRQVMGMRHQSMLKGAMLAAVVCGVYCYLEEYWDFPYCLFIDSITDFWLQ